MMIKNHRQTFDGIERNTKGTSAGRWSVAEFLKDLKLKH